MAYGETMFVMVTVLSREVKFMLINGKMISVTDNVIVYGNSQG